MLLIVAALSIAYVRRMVTMIGRFIGYGSGAVDPRRAVRRRERRRRLRRIAWNVVGLVVFAVLVFPVLWMISTAFKPDSEIISFTPTWFSTDPTLQHFRDAIARPFFWDGGQEQLDHRPRPSGRALDGRGVPRRRRPREVRASLATSSSWFSSSGS